MTEKKPENPPAFGRSACATNYGDWQIHDYGHAGMTLRDYFAAAALQGMLASGHQAPLEQFVVVQGGKAADGLALAAYGFSDAMLKARQS